MDTPIEEENTEQLPLEEGGEKDSNLENSPENSSENSPENSSEKEEEGQKSGEVILGKGIRIRFNEPLPHLDKGHVKAFRATGSGKGNTNLFALICDKTFTPRISEKNKYIKILNPNLPKLIKSGKVLWPPAKEERYCFVYEDTLGHPILKRDDNSAALGWKPELVMEKVAYPMISLLFDMRNKDLVHGDIWLGNMFDGGIKDGMKVKLGECLSMPASSHLPALYEPVERALASPAGRGAGSYEDELYSFGVSLAIMLRTTDPVAGLSDEDIVERKIEKGSYSTLIGKDRLKGATLELLRGLLYDDPLQRWTLDDVQAWMDGRRLSPKQSPKRVKATRPIVLNEKKYIRPELLAKDLHVNPDEVERLVENGDLDLWIDRAVEDKTIKARVEQAVQEIEGYEKGAGYSARLSVLLATALCPEYPMQYKNLSFIPEGFGKFLSHAYATKQDMQPFVDVLRYPFVMNVIRVRKSGDTMGTLSKFDSCRTFIKQSTLGSGIERCIYFLDPDCPCLSPILQQYYVQTPEEMMDAFEGICASNNPDVLFDRHVVSFLSIKDRKNIDPYMVDLGSGEHHRRALAQLRILATIQKRSRLGDFPAIANWISQKFEVVYIRFHDAKRRDALKKHIDKLTRGGDLTKMAMLFNDPKIYENDTGYFYQAMSEHKRLRSEKELIKKNLKERKNYGRKTGSQISSIISMILSVVIIFIIVYMALSKG